MRPIANCLLLNLKDNLVVVSMDKPYVFLFLVVVMVRIKFDISLAAIGNTASHLRFGTNLTASYYVYILLG